MAHLSPACCIPAPPYEYTEKGKEESLAGVDVYITRPDSVEASSAVVLIPDVHGWKIPQLRKVGDAVAAAGFLTLVPDFFQGDPFVRNPDGSSFPQVDWWLARHLPVNSVGTLQNILKALESQGITSYGLSGYCWGAKVAVLGEKGVHTGALKSLALLHPTFTETDEYRACRVPVAILAAESDFNISMETLKVFTEALDSRKEVDSFVKVYPGVEHGWTTHYDFADEAGAKIADEACRDMIEWHKKYT